MIFGECPYCGKSMALAVPDLTPCFQHVTCAACRKTYWEYLSRVSPMAYTEEAFAEKYEVDKDRHAYRERTS